MKQGLVTASACVAASCASSARARSRCGTSRRRWLHS